MAATRLIAAALVAATAGTAATAAAQHAHDHPPDAASAAAPGGATAVPAVAPMLHMRMTALRPAVDEDSARAARLTDAVRRGIARYRDVRAAERDGYKPVFVADTSAGQVLHYTHFWRGVKENWRLDPAKPGSLLYEVQPDGSRRLVGAMYTAPDRATPDQLDARVPLAYARWHLHSDLCVPKPLWSKREWARTLADGRPVFGPGSPVSTRAACEAQGGAFKDHMFGWMVHAMVTDNTRLDYVWGGGHDHGGMDHGGAMHDPSMAAAMTAGTPAAHGAHETHAPPR